MSRNPFSDSAETGMLEEDFMLNSSDSLVYMNDLHSSVATRPSQIEAPILETLSPVSRRSSGSCISALGTDSTTPTSPSTESPSASIHWNNADLSVYNHFANPNPH